MHIFSIFGAVVPTFSNRNEIIPNYLTSQIIPQHSISHYGPSPPPSSHHHWQIHEGAPSIRDLLANLANLQGSGEPINLHPLLSSPNCPPWLKRKLKWIQRVLLGPNIRDRVHEEIQKIIFESLIEILSDPRLENLGEANYEKPARNYFPIGSGYEPLKPDLHTNRVLGNDYNSNQRPAATYTQPNSWNEKSSANHYPAYKSTGDKSNEGWYEQRKPLDLNTPTTKT